MKTYAASYTSSVKNGSTGMEWVVLMSYDDEASTLRFAFKDTQILTVQYYGVLLGVSFGDSGFDPYTGANVNGSCTITLADDTNNTVSTLLSGKGFINRRVRVYRNCSGQSTPVSNDPEFDGSVIDYSYDCESRTWVFQCELLSQHRTIPQTVVTKAAYPKAPEYSIGATLPLLYGRFVMSDTSTRGDAVHGLFHVAPTICTDATEGVYVVAGHVVSAIDDEMVSMYLSGLETYGTGVHLWNGTSIVYPTVTLTGNASITLPVTNGRVYRANTVWLFPKLKGSYNQFASSSADAVDGDYNTDITIGASTRYAVRFPAGGLGDNAEFPATVSASDLQVLAWFKAHSGSAINGGIYNPIIAVNYTPSGLSGTGLMTWNIASPTSGTRSLNDGTTISSAAQWSFDEVALYEYYLSVPAASSVDVSTLCIAANLCVISGRIEKVVEVGHYRKRGTRVFGVNVTGDRAYTVEHVSYRYKADPIARERGLSNLFVTVDGRKFGSWIGSRNGLSTSSVIAKSNYIIESILRDEMGVDDAFIDETSFDNDYSSAYTFAFSLTQRESSQHVIQDLAKQSACYAFRKARGLWTIKRLPVSPSSADITLDYSLGDCQIKSIVKSPQTWVQNEVRVLYNYDYARGEYTRDVTDEDATSKGSTAPAVKATAIAEIGADFIRHDSDNGVTNYASSLRDYELSQWSYQHNLVEFDIMNPLYFYAEEGDVVTFDNVTQNLGAIGGGSAGDYWSSFTSPATAYWLIYSIVPYLDRVSCKAIQLHNL